MRCRQNVRLVLFIGYYLFIIWYAVLRRSPSRYYSGIKLDLLWSYRELLLGNPKGLDYVIQNVSNILFFVPFGLFCPTKDRKNVFFYAFIMSFAIEVTQAIGRLGLAELDDLLCNTGGALIGSLLWRFTRENSRQ